MTRSLRRSHCSSGLFGRKRAFYTLAHILGERYLVVRTGKSFLNFPRPHSIRQQWHYHQSTGYLLGSWKWLPHQAWCHRHPLQSQFCHWWAHPHPYTCGRHSLIIGRQPLSDATALLVDPLHALMTWSSSQTPRRSLSPSLKHGRQVWKVKGPMSKWRKTSSWSSVLTMMSSWNLASTHVLLALVVSAATQFSTHQCGGATHVKVPPAPGWRAVG